MSDNLGCSRLKFERDTKAFAMLIKAFTIYCIVQQILLWNGLLKHLV